jgi:hypothetical protein
MSLPFPVEEGKERAIKFVWLIIYSSGDSTGNARAR